MVSAPLLLEKVVLEGILLGHIPSLKLKDWDVVDHGKFPQLAPNKSLVKIYYAETNVMQLELMKWVMGVEKAGLLNMLWILVSDNFSPWFMLGVSGWENQFLLLTC